MDDFDIFKYGILGFAGLIIVAILIGFVFSTKELMRRLEFLERAAKSPPEHVSAWFDHYEAEFDFVSYTGTVLYVRIKGDSESRSFEYNDIERVVEALVRADISIQNPMPVVDKVRQRIAAEQRQLSRKSS